VDPGVLGHGRRPGDRVPAAAAGHLGRRPAGHEFPDNIWIPGCWIRQEGQYVWRPGFWEPGRPNWVWEPAHYVYTPRGCVYVDGYWDYGLDHRGVAFLPVYCPSSLYGRPGFQYAPDIALDLDGLSLNLFISPERHHYYFGDYYGSDYFREGFHPWYEASTRHDWYDPIFVHRQWKNRDDHQWLQHQREGYDHRRDDVALRPARTYEAMRAQVARLPEKDRKQAEIGRPMKEVVAEKASPMKFEAVDAKTREATANQAKEVHAYKDKRSQWESPSAAPKAGPEPKAGTAAREVVTPKEAAAPPAARELPKEPAKEVTAPEKGQVSDHAAAVKEQPAKQEVQSDKVKIPKSPIAVREPVRDKELTPPPRPEHPKPDPNAKAKPAKADAPDHSRE